MGAAADSGGGPQPPPRLVCALTAAWIANSAVCVLTNKHVLYYLKFSFPTTLAVLHMLSAFVTTAFVIHCTPGGRRHLPPPGAAPRSFYAKLAGIAALFGAVLVLANSAFMYLSVPSIQMLKAGSAATTFCVGLLFGTESYSHKGAAKVLIVGAGVVIASYGDAHAKLLGVAMQVASIVADAVRCQLLQLTMQGAGVKLTPVGTLYHVAPLAAAALALPAALAEWPRLRAHAAPIPYGWLLFSCATASSLNLVVFTLIGKTSALTTSITGPLKEWVCILTAMLVYHTAVTGQQWAGYAIALVGIAWYQRDKFFSGGGGSSSCGGAEVSKGGGDKQERVQGGHRDVEAGAPDDGVEPDKALLPTPLISRHTGSKGGAAG